MLVNNGIFFKASQLKVRFNYANKTKTIRTKFTKLYHIQATCILMLLTKFGDSISFHNPVIWVWLIILRVCETYLTDIKCNNTVTWRFCFSTPLLLFLYLINQLYKCVGPWRKMQIVDRSTPPAPNRSRWKN